MSKKRKIIFGFVFVLLIICSISVYLYIHFTNQKTLKLIKQNYNSVIKVNKYAKLYDKNKVEVGNAYKGAVFELDKINNISLENKYFKIKNTKYYLYYKDVREEKKSKKDILNEKYNLLGKKVVINKKDILYKNNNKYMTINNEKLDVYYIDKDKIYVYYLDRIFELKNNNKLKLIGDDYNLGNISILEYPKISDSCSDYNCVTTNSFKEQITKLKENGYYTITEDEYSKYFNKQLNLKDKAVMIFISEESEKLNSLSSELGVIINKKSDEKYDKIYQIKSYSTTDNLLKMANGENVVETPPASKIENNVVRSNGQGIAVINYHFFYDEASEACNETICLSTNKFREQLEYLKNNGYRTLTMKEFTSWMYGEIELPQKSVLLTIDDGAFGTGRHNGNKLIPLLEEYNMHATLFLIAGWWDISNYRSPNLEIQSHTFDMHQAGSCGKGQLVCADYNTAKADLQKSLNIIGDNTSFCYPFYSYDDEAIQAVKDLGFKIAFAGGNRKVTRNSNKYLVPRYPIYKSTTLQQFINMIS